MRSFWVLPALLGFPLTVLAGESAFEDSVLFSPMFISSSQSYQIKKQSCEVAAVFTRGNLVSKTIDLTLEAKSQGGGFHCGQSLEQNSLVIGIIGDIQQTTLDGVIVRFETLTTAYQPYLAFQLSPSFSLGVSQDMEHSENKTINGNTATSSHRLIVSGTWHQGPWETTFSYADRYRDTIASSADIPRSFGFAMRYAFSPLLAAGMIYTKTDYPGIATGDEPEEIGHDVVASLTSGVSDQVSIEFSYMTDINTDGNEDARSHIIGLVGHYKVNAETKITGFVNQFKGDDKALDTSMSAFGIGASLSR